MAGGIASGGGFGLLLAAARLGRRGDSPAMTDGEGAIGLGNVRRNGALKVLTAQAHGAIRDDFHGACILGLTGAGAGNCAGPVGHQAVSASNMAENDSAWRTAMSTSCKATTRTVPEVEAV